MRARTIAIRAVALGLTVAAAPPALSQNLQKRVEARLAEAGAGTRFGLLVATEDGREIVAIAPDSRFIPASNTKMFTTAAAFATLPGVDAPDSEGGAAVRLETGRGATDVVLEGRGDARLSSRADCVQDCLAELADAVAARTRAVRDVIGDDSLFPDQRWSPGMSWNNIPTRSGTGISALTLDDNELVVEVLPGVPGQAPRLEHASYYTIDNRAVTVTGGGTNLSVDRMPGSFLVRLTGTIGAEPERLRLGIDDPAYYAAWRLKALLEARGVRVAGAVQVQHRPLRPYDDPAVRNGAPPPRPPQSEPLAQLIPPPLSDNLTLINKISQNLHAELLLRRVALEDGTGSIADGVAAVKRMLAQAGVPKEQAELSDGSGMSTYNRFSPRGIVTFLGWARKQPWGDAYRATLPVGGVDGTLARRFKGTALEGRIFAKTGSLNATSALSGYLLAKSGQTLIFSAYANDVPEGVAASKAVDDALLAIAAEN
ncbi:MAG TPA: D-alanyl-D-alanine carboxypeptidase/D-alanyl-D-alanine-endopeptidase [Allosphingosinicella sp.]